MRTRANIFALLLLLGASLPLHAENLHLLDSRPNGYQIYRSGRPSASDLEEWCRRGITQVMVLSGDALNYELANRASCPQLKIVYNQAQRADVPLTARFLRRFDRWVQAAKRQGDKILFRCYCGCHRTGRLSAYYEMKYLSRSYRHVRAQMYRFGRDMDLYPYLFRQARALEDYIHRRPCRQDLADCVLG